MMCLKNRISTEPELREEADEHLETLRDVVDVGDGDIIEIDGDEVDGETAE